MDIVRCIPGYGEIKPVTMNVCGEKQTYCFKSKVVKRSLNEHVAVDYVSKLRLKSPKMKN